ncbi:MAG: chemotaxis protein CheW [Polyangiaceae bacterium]
MSGDVRLSLRAEAMRREFDEGFARAATRDETPVEDLLAIRVAGDPYALRLAECAGLFSARKVTPLPTTIPELLGLAGFRAALVPVYDLRALLGYPRGEGPRWMVSTAGSAVVALGFDAFEAHLKVDPASLVAADAPSSRHAPRLARLAGGACPLLSVPSLLDAIEARARPDRSKER